MALTKQQQANIAAIQGNKKAGSGFLQGGQHINLGGAQGPTGALGFLKPGQNVNLGTIGAYGGGGAGTMGGLANSYQRAYDEANAANESRYQESLGLADEAIELGRQSFAGQKDEIARGYRNLGGAQMQNSVSSGMYGTSNVPVMQMGIQREMGGALVKLGAAQAASERQGIMDKQGIIERRTDTGPNMQYGAQQAQGLGRYGGVQQPTTTGRAVGGRSGGGSSDSKFDAWRKKHDAAAKAKAKANAKAKAKANAKGSGQQDDVDWAPGGYSGNSANDLAWDQTWDEQQGGMNPNPGEDDFYWDEQGNGGSGPEWDPSDEYGGTMPDPQGDIQDEQWWQQHGGDSYDDSLGYGPDEPGGIPALEKLRQASESGGDPDRDYGESQQGDGYSGDPDTNQTAGTIDLLATYHPEWAAVLADMDDVYRRRVAEMYMSGSEQEALDFVARYSDAVKHGARG